VRLIATCPEETKPALLHELQSLGAQDGSEGYVVTTQRPGAWFRSQRRTFTARGIVMSAGALGTNRLLAKCKLGGSLPPVERRHDQRQHPPAADVARQRPEPSRDDPQGIVAGRLVAAWANVSTTAHILGGAVIGRDATTRGPRWPEPSLRVP